MTDGNIGVVHEPLGNTNEYMSNRGLYTPGSLSRSSV